MECVYKYLEFFSNNIPKKITFDDIFTTSKISEQMIELFVEDNIFNTLGSVEFRRHSIFVIMSMMWVYKTQLIDPNKFIGDIIKLFKTYVNVEYKYLALVINYIHFEQNLNNVLKEYIKYDVNNKLTIYLDDELNAMFYCLATFSKNTHDKIPSLIKWTNWGLYKSCREYNRHEYV